MNHNDKLFALIGLVGKAKVAEFLEMSSPTFISRVKNPGDWKVKELKVIEDKYNELFIEKVK